MKTRAEQWLEAHENLHKKAKAKEERRVARLANMAVACEYIINKILSDTDLAKPKRR
jgi:hypothetical protein